MTEQSLIWPAHWSIGIEAGARISVRSLLMLTTGEDRERQRAFSDTYQTSVSFRPALIGPLIL